MSPIPSPFRLLVVTPTLGVSPWLDDTVASVARLSGDVIHVLVTPVGKVAGLAARYPRVRVVAEPGQGMYAAINAGLAAVPDWDAFTYINDDDLLLPRFAHVAAWVGAGRAEVAYGGVRLIGTQGRRLGSIPISAVPSLNRLLYAQRIEPVYQHGTVFSRKLVDRIGPFDESFRFCGDSEFIARACVAGATFACVTLRSVAAFRLRAGQLTKDLPVMQIESDRVHAKLALPVVRVTFRHRWARLVFRTANLPVYGERIVRHGFIPFGELLARGQ